MNSENVSKNESYEQIKKNTVQAANQLKENEYVSFENPDGSGIRVLFVGNSITRHGAAPQIGWYNDCGMAASSKEKDYVHLLIGKINAVKADGAYCICQAAEWERKYKEGTEKLYPLFEGAHDFSADIIIIRLIENCSFAEWDSIIYKNELAKLIAYFNSTNKAHVIVTNGFWHHCGDEAIKEFAQENNIPFVELGDLGELDEMKAVGLFEHSGVAAHPGDLGMEKIAERIYDKIDPTIRKIYV